MTESARFKSRAETRRAAERKGRLAEWLVQAAYGLRGFTLVEKRFRLPGRTGIGEIDLALLRGRLLVLVEVKARADADAAISAVTPTNRRRIIAAGRALMAARPQLADCAVRYDIAAVSGLSIKIVRDAWRDDMEGM